MNTIVTFTGSTSVMKKSGSRTRAFSVLETLVAAVIMLAFILPVMYVFTNMSSSEVNVQKKTECVIVGTSLIELLKSVDFKDIGTWDGNMFPSSGDNIFTHYIKKLPPPSAAPAGGSRQDVFEDYLRDHILQAQRISGYAKIADDPASNGKIKIVDINVSYQPRSASSIPAPARSFICRYMLGKVSSSFVTH